MFLWLWAPQIENITRSGTWMHFAYIEIWHNLKYEGSVVKLIFIPFQKCMLYSDSIASKIKMYTVYCKL